MNIKENIIGNTYGKWLVLERVRDKNRNETLYKCECQCYFKTVRNQRRRDLIKGKTKKCKHCSNNEFIEYEYYYKGITSKGEIFYFDKTDYDIAVSNTWSVSKGYVVAKKNGKNIRFHREVIKKTYPNIEYDDYIDHINKNKTDNRRSNLRICNSSVNQENRKIQKNTTGYKGIKLISNGKYQVKICKDYKEHYLGTFDILDDAIYARRLGEQKLHSETFRIMEVMPEIEFEEVKSLDNESRGGFGTTSSR